MHSLLEEGNQNVSLSVRFFCSDVGAREPALWTFVTSDGVEPTNNADDQAFRPADLWRKGCFGADSDDGNVFVARILTVRETCRPQQRHLLSFLIETVAAYRAGLSPPLLVAGGLIGYCFPFNTDATSNRNGRG